MKRGWKGREGKESLPNVNFLVTSLAANSCRLLSLLRCACKTGLSKCIRAKLRCSALCRCGDHCENTNGQ